MKQLVLSCVAIMLLGGQVLGQWAAHLVISPAPQAREPKSAGRDWSAEAAQLARGVTVRPAEKGRVSIVLKAAEEKGEMGKAYYLMVSQKRLLPGALDLRSALGSTSRMKAIRGRFAPLESVPEGFVEVRPLPSVQKDGENVIEVVLDREVALRSYIVWDFRMIYEKAAMIMDGGLWLTYDLPAFVEAMDAAGTKTR